jgi:hypothetical protein
MKKTYITPVTEEIKLNYQYSLLVNSVFNTDDDISTIVDDEDIVDTGGVLDPESREYFMDEEAF